ncbi:MAG: hypothetical protein JKY16_04140 [Lutibacter sp.]|nr:hypothetical protein [Lutibacter sp.]
MELTNDVLKRITISDGIKEYKNNDIKEDFRMFRLLKNYFKYTNNEKFNELIKSDNPIKLETNKIRTTIKIVT